jgi:hypothetical protein
MGMKTFEELLGDADYEASDRMRKAFPREAKFKTLCYRDQVRAGSVIAIDVQIGEQNFSSQRFVPFIEIAADRFRPEKMVDHVKRLLMDMTAELAAMIVPEPTIVKTKAD